MAAPAEQASVLLPVELRGNKRRKQRKEAITGDRLEKDEGDVNSNRIMCGNTYVFSKVKEEKHAADACVLKGLHAA